MKEILYAIAVLGAMGAIFGAVLALASRLFAVKTDERLPLLLDALPGANCGGCGFAGCAAYAQAVIDGKAAVGLCAVGGAESANKMAAIMGVEANAMQRSVAMVKCRGRHHLSKGNYEGIDDCMSAMFVAGDGPSACGSGCLGFGNCMKVCMFGAISLVDGIARIDADKCTGCLQCVSACPRHVIVEVSQDADIVVACSNHDRGAELRSICDLGCVGCHLCEQQCEFDAIHVVKSLATIDYSKCVSCGRCAAVCPRGIIADSNLRRDMDVAPSIAR
ncbi:MAG: RnfABCDGE type electron transport complex subunit B [Oscillospiraceae bacterium]|jgi:Na+-translocating ferredoxin:NAD+ oxidoreductase RNF subunit RnfB|nr:RnfABCDGE type electron transport complex subunit B [Oscillospiraceae bacterium]